MSLLQLTQCTTTSFNNSSTKWEAGWRSGRTIGCCEKQQGQCTEAVVTTHCIIHWAHASVLHGSCIGLARMSTHKGHSSWFNTETDRLSFDSGGLGKGCSGEMHDWTGGYAIDP